MRKQLCIMLSFVLIFAASFSFSAFGLQSADIEPTQLGDSSTYYSYNASSKTLTISGSGSMPNFTNSEKSIPWYNWRSDGSIENVVIEEGITSVGNYSFASVKASDFTIPSTLTKIGNYAFYSTNAAVFELPFGLKTIGNNAFEENVYLESVSLPDTLTSIGGYAFKMCIELESITIPYSVRTIGSYAFDRCLSLKSLVFQDLTASVTLSSYAFYDCAMLGEVTFPSGAVFKTKSFGINRTGVSASAKMKVYPSSSAYIYAVNNGVSYEEIDEVYPLSLGIPSNVSFNEKETDKAYTFTLKPDFSSVYNIYSLGETDVKAELWLGETLLTSSDDISSSDRNFCLTYELTAHTDYVVKVYSVGSVGTSVITMYPDVINSFDIKGSLSFSAADGLRISDEAYFPITDSSLDGFILDIHFNGGYSDKIYYSAGYFDNKQISLYDTQSAERFTCGENAEKVRIGTAESTFPVYVEHSYAETVVPYTLDEDGYTLHTCVLCGDSYKSDFVPSPAITVSGRCLLMTSPDGAHSGDIPLNNVTVSFRGRTFSTDDDGYFSFRTFIDGELTVSSPYCDAELFEISVQEGEAALGDIALPAYDFNRDGYINGRDLAYFKLNLRGELPRDYFSSAVNFM